MASDWTAYRTRPILLDVTVPKLAADDSIESPESGSAQNTAGTSLIEVTTNSIQSTSLNNSLLYDGTELEIISPVDSNGTLPDVEVTFTVDGTDLKQYLVIDGSGDGNMFPPKKNMVGQRTIKLGLSLRDLLLKAQRGQNIPNLALLATGFKIAESITVTVKSVAGWGQTAAANTPMRIILRGDALHAVDIDSLTGVFMSNSSVQYYVQGIDKPLVVPYLDVTGKLSDAWQTLPGGAKQAAAKINRRIVYATNQADITSQNYFIFSRQNALQGQTGNVLDPQHDLGDNFINGRNAFIYKEFGLRLAEGVEGYIGLRVNGNIIPQDTTDGTPVSTAQNDWHYGSVQPLRSESNLFYPLPASDTFVGMMAYNSQVVPSFKSASGSIGVGNVKIAKGGVLIEKQ